MSKYAIPISLFLLSFSAPTYAKVSWTPMKLRQTSGTRPYVKVRLNGVPFSFMVHSNAGFFAMTTHANAAKAHVGKIRLTNPSYGIVSPGHVSKLGSGVAQLKTLQVGTSIRHDVPLRVFEIPPRPVVDGMLGIKWLRATGAIVDFSRLRLGIPAKDGDAGRERQELLSQGFVAHPMKWDDADNRYVVKVSINGVPATFAVSTVAYLVIDDHLASKAGIALTPPVDHFDGPSGTTGIQYANASPVKVVIDGQTTAVPKASIYDIFAYDGVARPKIPSIEGFLGCEFMIPNRGVIDFGKGVLYLKPTVPKP